MERKPHYQEMESLTALWWSLPVMKATSWWEVQWSSVNRTEHGLAVTRSSVRVCVDTYVNLWYSQKILIDKFLEYFFYWKVLIVYNMFITWPLGSGSRQAERPTVNRGDGGSIPLTAVSKLRQFRSPLICLSFGRDTKSRWSLLSGI